MVSHIARFAVLLSVLMLPGASDAADPDEIFTVQQIDPLVTFESPQLSDPDRPYDLPQNMTQSSQQPSAVDLTGLDCLSSKPSSGAPPPFPTVTLSGFFQADAAWFAQDERSTLAVGDIPDIVDFRRARLTATGQAFENVGYMVDFDFAFPGRPTFMDVFLDLQDLPIGTVRVGQWRQPFGMDALSSAKELWFLERALPFAMLPFRQTGIGAFNTALDERLTWAISGYKYPVGPFGGNFGDSGYGMSTRVTFNPLYDETTHEVIHAGINYSINNPSTRELRFRTTPEIGFTQGDFSGIAVVIPFFLDTGPIRTNVTNLLGAELAAAFGPLTIQSELTYVLVDQAAGPSLAFPGAYAQMAYALTGEHHPYRRTGGFFTRIIPTENFGPDAGCGAWEVAARWSYLDLDDENISGGKLHDLTVGLNWTLNPNTRIQFNYIHAFLDHVSSGKSNTGIVAMRAQVDF